MNPLNPFAGPVNPPGEPITCIQVWSTLKPDQRDNVQRVMLLVCRHLAEGRDAQTTPAPSNTEVAHERA